MENAITTYGSALTHHKVAKVLFSSRAAWVWSLRGDRILWANELGCRFFKTKSMPDLLSRTFRRISPATSQISQFGKNATVNETTQAELCFLRGMTPIMVDARLTLIELPEDGRGVLVEALDADPRFDATLSEKGPLRLMKLFSRGEEATALLSEDCLLQEASTAFREASVSAAAMGTLAKKLTDDKAPLATLPVAGGTLTMMAMRKKKGNIFSYFAIFSPSFDDAAEAPADEIAESEATPAVADTTPAVEEAPASIQAIEPQSPERPEFVFTQSSTPSRFLFEFSSDGVLTSTSQDFVATLGEETGAVNGEDWDTLSDRLNLDPDSVIATHLAKQAIWNESVLWPVSLSEDDDGVPLRVPISLTAMPVFDRHRLFEGFRGFGVIQTAKAARHPDRDLPPVVVIDNEPEVDPVADDGVALDETVEFAEQPAAATEVENTPTESDVIPLHGAKVDEAASNIVPLHSARPTIVRADDDDDTAPNLSKPERRAFEEIARALAKPPNEDAETTPTKTDEANSIDFDAANAIEGTSKRASTSKPTNTPENSSNAAEDKKAGQGKTSISSIAKGLGVGAAAILGAKALEKRDASEKLENQNIDVNKEDSMVDKAPSDTNGVQPAAALANAAASDDNTPTTSQIIETAPASDELQDGVLDRLPLGLIVTRNREVLFANRAVLDFLGHDTLEKFKQAGGVDRLFTPETDQQPGSFVYRDMFRHLVIQADSHDRPTPQAARARLSDGTTAPVDVRLQSGLWRNEDALLMTIATPVYRDGAEATADTRISDLIGQSTDVMDIASDGILILDNEGNLLHANASAEALFGQDRRDIRDLSFVSLFAEESQKSASDYLDSLTSNGVASILNDGREVIGREANGGLIPLFMTIGRVNKSRSNSPVFCAVLRDITQWKRAEEELIESRRLAENANAQKSDFLAKVSHEIRTPLNAIIGFSDVMMNEHFGPMNNPRYLEYARDIHNSGEYLVSLVNDLLDLSKIEAGKLDLTFASVNINKVLQESVALLQPDANRERIIIRTSLLDALPPVVADTRSIRQIALNLLSNAVKFTNAGGQVIVSTTLEESGNVIIRVRDTGIGMSPEDLERALEPFRQVSTDTHGRTSGTGLGLPLTKALVEANRAQFSIDSRLNYGTLIQVVFPTERVLAQ